MNALLSLAICAWMAGGRAAACRTRLNVAGIFDAGDILITNGGSEALQVAMNCILDDGDEILIPEPFYPNYNTMAYTCGAKIHPIPTSPHDGYHYADRAKVEAEINEHTRAIMVTNPGNPTGAVLSEARRERLAELAREAGLPRGVFQVLPGFGHTVGKALALSMGVDCLAFTGSTGVGKQLMQYAGQSNLKRVYLECGGKSPNIVFADCKDLDRVAKHAAAAIFHNQGEVCIAGSRLLVENAIREAFIDRVVAAAERMQPGDPLDPESFMGAIVDEAQYRRILGYIEKGREEGARLRAGGEATQVEGRGLFIPPTVFDGVTPEMAIGREEIFGPVLSVFGFDTEEEAVAMANDSVYGLAAGLWSQDIDRIMRVTRRLHSGQVFVNNWAGGDQTMPFGGVKQSGNGRDKSHHSLEEYSTLKSVWMSLAN